MVFLGTPVPLWKYMLVWPLPLYVALIHDLRTKRTVHPVYAIGLVTMLIMRLILPFRDSQAWQNVAALITGLYRNSAN
jgi:hypothetical protein